MICKNCRAYYMRPPCPSCGREDKNGAKEGQKHGANSISPQQERSLSTKVNKVNDKLPSFTRYSTDTSGLKVTSGSEMDKEGLRADANTSSTEPVRSENRSEVVRVGADESGPTLEDYQYRTKVSKTMKKVIDLLEELIEE